MRGLPSTKGRAGLTLIELIIVLAVITIIGAILIPNFLNVTDKARLKSDVQSARVIGNAVDLYNAEQSAALSATDAGSVISSLNSAGYIDSAMATLQTDKAVWGYDTAAGLVVVNIAGCDEHIRSDIYGQLSAQDKQYVRVQ